MNHNSNLYEIVTLARRIVVVNVAVYCVKSFRPLNRKLFFLFFLCNICSVLGGVAVAALNFQQYGSIESVVG